MNDFIPHISETIDHIVSSIQYFKPELAISIAFVVTIFSSLFVDKYWKHSSFLLFGIGLTCSFWALIPQLNLSEKAFFDMLTIDSLSVYARGIVLLSIAISSIFIQQHFIKKTNTKRLGDIYVILLATTLGLQLMTLTTHWILTFIAIEIVSIGSYILVSYFAENKKQSEAAMKYVLFGSTCAAFMLYGLSLIYGFTGTLDFVSTKQMNGLISAPPTLTVIALLFVFVGIGFKLGFVPFHVWTPDVYEGAPTPITAFLSTVPKIGAIILFGRLLTAWTENPFYFGEITLNFLFFVAIITMLVGNLVALRQQNLKRLMAYSSIGHTGFLLMALIALMQHQPETLLFYLTIYTIMNLGVFGFIDVLEHKTNSNELSDMQGLGKQLPLLFSCFTLTGISLVGLPPTAGFVGKLLVFTSVFERYQSSDQIAYLLLLIVGVLTSVISLFYYLKVPLYAFLRKSDKEITLQKNQSMIYIIAIIFSILTFVLGIFPHLLIQLF